MSTDYDSWKLPGAIALGGQRRPGAWLVALDAGWSLVGAPLGSERLLRVTRPAPDVRLVVAIDTHRYHIQELQRVVAATGAPAYALPEAIPILAGRAEPPEADEEARSPLLRLVGALFAALAGPWRPLAGVRELAAGQSPPGAPALRIHAIDGLAPGSAALIDEARGYLLLAGAASNGQATLRLAPPREVRSRRLFLASLNELLARPLDAVLFQLGPPLVGSAAIDRLRALVARAA